MAHTTKTRWMEDNKTAGVLGVIHDVTELTEAKQKIESIAIEKLLLEEREKQILLEYKLKIAKAKAEAEEASKNVILILAGEIAHDQRSPIMTVYHVAMNYEKIIPKLLTVYDEAKMHNLASTTIITKKELDYIRHDHGVKALKRATFDMNELIDHSLHHLKIAQRALAGEITPNDLKICQIHKCLFHLTHNSEIKEGEEDLIHVDYAYHFEFRGNTVITAHILSNLLSNALYQIRKNKKGEIFVSTEDGGDVNLIKFKDTAGGAPPEVLNNMFEGFYTTKGTEGTGVGLSFCKNMMHIFGGSITAQSVEGDYMEFTLSFPKIKDYVSVNNLSDS